MIGLEKGDNANQRLEKLKNQKEKELNELKSIIITNKQLAEEAQLDLNALLENQAKATKNNNDKGSARQLAKSKKELKDFRVGEEEISQLCQLQEKITELEIKLQQNTAQKTQQLTKIINNISVVQGHAIVGCEFGDNTNLSYTQEKESENLITQTKKQLSIESQTKTNQREAKLIKTIEQTYQEEPMQLEANANWQNIHFNFTPQLTQLWQNHNFTHQQTQEWANISSNDFNPQEPAFYAWLRDTKNLTPEQVLNNGHLNSLKQEYQTQQQTYIQQTNLPPQIISPP